MKIRVPIIRGALRVGRVPEPSRQARIRLDWFDFYQKHDRNARKTCRHFGISPQTFYRWKRRYNPGDISSLEERSRRPHHLRQPTASPELMTRVLKVREENPRWGKEKIARLLVEQGSHVAASMIGRILRRLKDRGVLKEPAINPISVRKRQHPRPYAIRKPREYVAAAPGDIVQIDTMDVRPLPGVVIKHFTARDVISRWDVIEAHSRATSATALSFIKSLLERAPFPVRSIQVDGGSEFEAVFEEECQRLGIRLFVLPPRSPKLNGHVERANRTHAEEFYELTDCSFDLGELNQALLLWEKRYNTVRPHQALGYLTPKQYLDRYFPNQRKEVMCH